MSDWRYTEETPRGPLFVGAVTDEMVERAARAMHAREESLEPHDEPIAWDALPAGCDVHRLYLDRARIALVSALQQKEAQ